MALGAVFAPSRRSGVAASLGRARRGGRCRLAPAALAGLPPPLAAFPPDSDTATCAVLRLGGLVADAVVLEGRFSNGPPLCPARRHRVGPFGVVRPWSQPATASLGTGAVYLPLALRHCLCRPTHSAGRRAGCPAGGRPRMARMAHDGDTAGLAAASAAAPVPHLAHQANVRRSLCHLDCAGVPLAARTGDRGLGDHPAPAWVG